jgi:hypothetical protein
MIEDFDLIDPEFAYDFHPKIGIPPAMSTELCRKLNQATIRLLKEHGADLYYARRLYSMLRANGLVDVGVSAGGYSAWGGGTAGANLRIANAIQSRDEIIATGILSEKEFEDVIDLMRDPHWQVFSYLMISCWGRKP